MQTTKALSLLQPWASLVVMGFKKIETRAWSTNYRGNLLIHASAGKSGALLAEDDSIKKHIPDFKSLPFGCIIGEVELTNIVRIAELSLQEDEFDKLSLEVKAFGDNDARFAWLFEKAVVYDEPIPATGRLGLWEF